MSKNRSEYIRQAIKHIIDSVGSRKEFYEKLGKTYARGSVSRATLSVWIKNGQVPLNKAGLLASWSKGKYTAEDLCPQVKNLQLK